MSLRHAYVLMLIFIFFFFGECSGIQFFNSLTCDLGDTMPRQRSLTLFFPPKPLTSSLTLPWTIARFLDPFYTFSPAHRRVIRDLPRPTLFTVSATDLKERFLLSGIFYLTLLIPKEAEDFPRGDRHFKHVPLPTYFICLSPKELYTEVLFKSYGRSNL